MAAQPPGDAKRIAKRTPIIAVCVFLATLGAAIGHHVYYRHLADTEVQSESQQAWSIRVGTLFAFLVRLGLVSLLWIVADQQIWKTLRRKAMTLGSINSMFGIMGDPTRLFSWDLVSRAKLLTLFAVMAWLMPLLAIFTPATLSVQPLVKPVAEPRAVRTVNFTNDDQWATFEGAGRIYGPGIEISRLFTEVSSSHRVTPQPAPFPNATYDLEFWGPSYKCEDPDAVFARQNEPTWDLGNYNHSSLREAFFAELPFAAANRSDTRASMQLYQAAAPFYLDNMIFIFGGGGGELTRGGAGSTGTRLICQMHNTSYSITMEFVNGSQTIIPRNIEYLEPQAWDSSAGAQTLLQGTEDVLPSFYTTHLLFTYLLVNNITMGASGTLSFPGNGGAKSIPLLQSALIYCPEIANATSDLDYLGIKDPSKCRNGTLARAIEDLSRNFTLSTMMYQHWGDNATVMVPITVSSPLNYYAYDMSTLMIAYGVGFGVVIVCLAWGGLVLLQNGISSSTSFSTVMLTTRNPDLDELAVGHWLGAKPLPGDINGVRLRFGMLKQGGHPGFGVEGGVVSLKESERGEDGDMAQRF
ncbi:hypothetical protein B0H67DRAFT_550094 [Lasiosphaeris hirsuta]|uniref:Uncharacterized protein n=1 Tax=Lasiosphaeris hirsuta TaxID=260670 RepID=A0AA40AYE5_9PEZI|nr:hypothetical protein B0H67DRAFT_550094 [Lasiosphaeris hirsuta]